MAEKYDDLTVMISLSYREADNLAEFVAAYGNNDEDRLIADAIRYAMKQASDEQRDRDKRAPRK